jgi:F420-dependent methylenetetrahydromethanopterin dehydrogenase
MLSNPERKKRPACAAVRLLIRAWFDRLLATVPNTLFRLVPTVVIVATAAIETSAAINPYSIAVAPSSFFNNAMRIEIVVLSECCDSATMHAKAY